MERYSRVNLLGPGRRLMKKKNLPGRGLTKVEKHCSKTYLLVLRDARSNRVSRHFFSDFILRRSHAFSKDLLEGCKFHK